MILFGKAVELLGGGDFLEKFVTGVGFMLVLSGLTSSICLLCESEDKTSTLSALATRLSLTLCRPSCHNLLYLSGAVSQNKSFLPYVIYTRAFYPRNRKKNQDYSYKPKERKELH